MADDFVVQSNTCDWSTCQNRDKCRYYHIDRDGNVACGTDLGEGFTLEMAKTIRRWIQLDVALKWSDDAHPL